MVGKVCENIRFKLGGGEIVRTLLAERLYSERRKAPTVAVVRTEYAIKTCTS